MTLRFKAPDWSSMSGKQQADHYAAAVQETRDRAESGEDEEKMQRLLRLHTPPAIKMRQG